MSNTENKGYRLADGSWSSEYSVGDKFIVSMDSGTFSQGSVVELSHDDGSSCPMFKLVDGECFFHLTSYISDGEYAFSGWISLLPLKEESKKATGNVENTRAGKATIYYTDGTTYTQTNVNYCVYIAGANEFVFVLASPITTKLLADVYMESESVKLNTQHIAGIVFKRGSYEEIYKLKPTFQSSYNVYDKKNVSVENYRQKIHSQKPRVVGDYVNRSELTEEQAKKFVDDCIASGCHNGEGCIFIGVATLPLLGWHVNGNCVYYSNTNNTKFTNDVTHIYKES